jgi:uncharacterized protein (TIGR02001 family)
MMKKMMVGFFAAAIVSASVAVGADVSVNVGVASAYVVDGSTFNDGLVVQPELSVTLPYGLDLVVWGNIDVDDYDGQLEKGQVSEIDFYLSYALPVDLLDISIGYTEYMYPGIVGKAEREVEIVFGRDLGLVDVGLGLFYGIDGGIDKKFITELSVGKSMDLCEVASLDLGASARYLNPDEGESGFSGYTLSAGLTRGILSASVRYYGQIDDEVLVDRTKVVLEDGTVAYNGSYDVEVVGMLSLSLDF